MTETRRTLKKNNIGLLEGILFVIGSTIGSGIFLKPSVVLDGTGSTTGALLMWVFGGLITMCAALSIAELAANIPKVGGLYTYLVELYGKKTGFLYGWVEAVISSPGSAAALAIAFATFSTYFLPMNNRELKVTAILIILTISAAQILSTRFGIWIQSLSTIGKLVPVLAITVFGALHDTVGRDINTELIGTGGGTAAALLGVLWAYDGWLNICTLGGEMKKSERNLPVAVITGVILVTAVYITFNLAVFHVLTGEEAMRSDKIGVDAAVALFGNGATVLVTVGMMLSAFGSLNAQIACGTRIAFAMGERKQLPGAAVLSSINPILDTPVNSLIFQTILAIIYVISGTFHQITDLIIFVIWIFFTLGILGVFRLRRKAPRRRNLYRVPLYPVIPALGASGGIYLLFVTIRDSFQSAVLGGGLMFLGLGVYYYCGRKYR
jgi:APA family basic amino acid/polyamine antiporter